MTYRRLPWYSFRRGSSSKLSISFNYLNYINVNLILINFLPYHIFNKQMGSVLKSSILYLINFTALLDKTSGHCILFSKVLAWVCCWSGWVGLFDFQTCQIRMMKKRTSWHWVGHLSVYLHLGSRNRSHRNSAFLFQNLTHMTFAFLYWKDYSDW